MVLLLSAASACGSHSSTAKPTTAQPTTAPPTTSQHLTAQHVTFADSAFTSILCPAPHTLANCFSGTGTTTIAPLGRVTLARTVVSGDQKRSAPSGCDPADTVGMLTGADGATATLSGTGTLCGAVATYTLLVDRGTGSFAKLHLTGTIHNDGGAESWDIASVTSS